MGRPSLLAKRCQAGLTKCELCQKENVHLETKQNKTWLPNRKY